RVLRKVRPSRSPCRPQSDDAAARVPSAFCEFGEGGRVVGVPARQRRAVLDNVARRPKNALSVDLAGHLVVRAENIEIARGHPLDQEFDDLIGGPRAGGLLSAAAWTADQVVEYL